MRTIMQPKPPIDLATGFPAPSLLPVTQLQEASAKALSNPTVWEDGMVYGADDGYFPLRENIASWLTGYYKPPAGAITADRICISGGASQDLACILQVFTDPIKTRKVWVVEPSYFLGFRIFEDAGFQGRLRGVPEDYEGLDVEFLERALREERREFEASGLTEQEPIKKPFPYRKLYSHVIYCVPTFSNPSGVVMSRSRREALIRLAREYDALIVSDDVYDFVHFNSESESSPGSFSDLKPIQPRLVDLDRSLDGGPQDEFGNTVSNGSFSKIAGPGCRVGWAEGTPKFIYGLSQAGSSRSGGAPSHLMSTFINELLINDFIPTHIASTLIPAYQHRYLTMKSAIERHLLPLGVSFNAAALSNPAAGGFFFWLKLPSPLKAQAVLDAASKEENLTFGIGPFSALPEGNAQVSQYEDMIRLCFSRVDHKDLVESVVRLAGVIVRLLPLF